MPARNQKPTDAKWVLDQHEHSSGLFSDYLEKCYEVEKVFKAEWNIPKDKADKDYISSPDVIKPARPRAVVDKFLTMLAVRSSISMRVMPKKVGEEEERKCSLIENWLQGYQWQYQLETKKRVWRDFVYWSILRGRGCIETRYDPSYLNTDYLPIRTLVPDPMTVFPVWGENGIGWYTKQYSRYKWDILSELSEKEANLPDLSDVDDNDMVKVVEYWNKEWCALLVNEKLVWNKEHNYGFVPLSEAHIRATPLESADWSAQSVLYPILNTLKNQFALVSKMATAVDVGFWPKVLYQSVSGLHMIDTSSTPPGLVDSAAADAKLTVIPYQPNYQVLNALMAWLRGDEQVGGIVDIAWGSEPNQLESGFAISQVLAQVQDKIWDEKIAIEMALGWDASHKLQLIEKYGDVEGNNLTVPISSEAYAGYPKATRRPTLLAIKSADVEGRHHVEVTITPDIPQERMVKSQLAAAYRTPGVDGLPLLDDITIRERIIEDDHPDQTARRILHQMLASSSKVVQETLMLAAEKEWLDENKELVKMAAKRQEELTNPDDEETIPVSQVKKLIDLAVKDALSGGAVQEAIALQDATEAGEIMPPVPLPSSVAPPGGPSPQTMPSQMGMMPQEEVGNPDEIQMMQQRRMRPQNGR